MPWVRLDDNFPIHRKVAGLTDTEFRLHVSAICWCARNLTDGVVTRRDLPHIAAGIPSPARPAAVLVQRGLWHRTERGWTINGYLDYQPSREKVEAEREGKRIRQQRWRAGQSGKARDVDASRDASRDGAPYPPRPEGRRGAVRAVPDWCGRCDERTRQAVNADGVVCRCPDCHPLAGGMAV
jgi:hypothetical protein